MDAIIWYVVPKFAAALLLGLFGVIVPLVWPRHTLIENIVTGLIAALLPTIYVLYWSATPDSPFDMGDRIVIGLMAAGLGVGGGFMGAERRSS